MQQNRRRDPYPITWEVPAGIAVAIVSLAVLGLHLGRGIANLLAGGWWAFPDRKRLFTSLPGLFHGDAAAGLTPVEGPLASSSLLWTCIITVETILFLVVLLVVKAAVDRWGPNRTHGLATRTEAERLLGRARLRRHAPIVRPDLHGKNRRQL